MAAPDEERGAVVRAVVVLRDGVPEPDPELVRELQDHVKRETAPYKYPRIVEFAAELPKTASGKIKRAELRGEERGAGGEKGRQRRRWQRRGAYSATTASISTWAPRGRAATPIATRAGGSDAKKRP